MSKEKFKDRYKIFKMEENKYHLIGVFGLFGKYIIGIFIFILLVFLIGFYVLTRSLLGIFVVFLIFVFIIVLFGIVILFQKFVVSKWRYIQLNDDSLTISWGNPFVKYTYDYNKFKSIKFSDGKLKYLDVGVLTPFPIYSKIENPDQFINEFKQKYKKATGKELKIIA